MSAKNFAGIATAIGTILQPQVESIFNRKAALFNKIRALPGSGKNHSWVIKALSGQPSSTAIYLADGNASGTANTDTGVTATLPFSIVSEPFGATPLAMNAANSDAAPDAIMDLITAEGMDAVDRLVSNLNMQVYLGTGAASPQDLAGFAIAMIATGSYGGLARGTYTLMVPTIKTGSAGALTRDMVSDLIQSVRVAGGDPDVLVCGPTTYTWLEKLGSTNVTQYVGQGDNSLVLAMGSTGLQFNGIPVLLDKDAPAATIYALSMSDFEFRYLNDVRPNVGKVKCPNGLVLNVVPLAFDGSIQAYQLTADMQLVCKSGGQKHGKLTNFITP